MSCVTLDASEAPPGKPAKTCLALSLTTGRSGDNLDIESADRHQP